MHRVTVLTSLLAACGTGLHAWPDSGEDGAVSITSITPDQGPPEGGTPVTLTGTGFDGPVEVEFGTFQVPATKIGADQLLVSTPAIGAEIAVDVTVTTELGSATVPGGFTFTRNPDTDTDTGSGTGKVGGVAQLILTQIACPDCFGYPTNLSVTALAAFHEPTTGSWVDWMPAVGSCISSPNPVPPVSATLDVGEWVFLTAGSTSIGLRRTIDSLGTIYEASGIDQGDFERNAYYDLGVPDGGSLGAFDVVDALLTPQGFDALAPYEMLYIDPSAAFSAAFYRSGTAVQWSPYGGAGSVAVLIEAYHPSSGAYLGAAMCRGADNGSMTFPGSLLGAWPNYALLAVSVYRYEVTDAILPRDGSTLQSVAQIGVLGTGYLQP